MSDFDREAERERLREKYEQDKTEREATERMSELLLQGATMTNAHCSECGDPIFRYDGQEFCATCERPVERGNGTDTGGETGESDDTGVEVTTPDDETRVVFGGEDSDTAETQERRDRQRGPAGREQQQTGTDGQAGTGSQASSAGGTGQPVPPEDTDSGAEIEAARASLARTLTAFSRRAEEADDPRRARDHLQTAREAAEALAALRRS